MAEQRAAGNPLEALVRLPEQLSKAAAEGLAASMEGLPPETRALAAALLGDATRLLPPPLGTPLRYAARAVLAQAAPEAAAAAAALDSLLSVLAGLLALTPALTLGVLLGLATAPKS